jgi:hypothetical protein
MLLTPRPKRLSDGTYYPVPAWMSKHILFPTVRHLRSGLFLKGAAVAGVRHHDHPSVGLLPSLADRGVGWAIRFSARAADLESLSGASR